MVELFEDLVSFVSDMNKFKLYKNKQEKVKKSIRNHTMKVITNLTFQMINADYRNNTITTRQKLYQSDYPELSYREPLKFVY